MISTLTLNQLLLMNKKTIAAGKLYTRLLLSAFLVLLSTGLFAQQKKISGTVVNPTDNKPLANISVLVKGTARGTTTDPEGRFSISAAEGETLVFSAIGYTPKEVKIGKNETITVDLAGSDAELESVIVTALGIKRDQKGLGYASQSVKGDELLNARSNNFINALSGKVAGLNLISPGSGPINSVRVSLRGDNSLNPENNNALIVLDGVPMYNRITSSGVSSAYGAGSGNDVPIDFGNGIADINPDDIESITVLKGASATALYGNRAANGALLITTKSGARKGKGIGVTINSNSSMNTILKWPELQYEYGQGTGTQFSGGKLYYSYGNSADGLNTGSTSSAFGPKFDGQSYFQYDPGVQGQSKERKSWVPYKDNVKGFWRNGYTLANSVAVETGSDKASARASLTHTKNEWIMPNTGFERINAALSVNFKASDKLKFSSKVNYTNKRSDNLPATGYNNQSISYFMIFQNPNVDLAWYRDVWKKDKQNLEQIHPFSSFIDNPYLITYEMTNSMRSNAIVGTLSGMYEFSKKFDLMVRSGINTNTEEREQRRPWNSANFLQGYYRQQNINFTEVNTDFLLTYKEKLSQSFRLSVSAGANRMDRKYRIVNASVDGLMNPAEYKLSNGISAPNVNTGHANKKVNSVYGFTNLSWRDRIFLDITGRNDWSSVLPSFNRSFFYPSVSTSFVLNELFRLPAIISFAKFRLSAAEVGNDTEPYRTKKYYLQTDFPSSATAPTTLHNDSLKPELTRSYEAGLAVNFANNRFGVDVTVYRNFTRNQIIESPLDWSTGFSKLFINAGEVRNQGIEVVITARPVSRPNFKWNTTITWSKNENKIQSLSEGMGDEQVIASGGGVATIIAKNGGSTGDIYGFGFLRAPDGQIIYGTNGLPARPDGIQLIGNAYPGWKGGVMNEFTYNNFRFSFLVDGQYGGIVYSQTHHKMTEQGKLQHTLRGREDGFIIGEGVVADGAGGFKQNTTKATLPAFYADYWRRANVESNSFDASYLKLREVRFEYTVPKKYTSKLRINNLTIALYGRDLAMLTSFPMFDPETAALNGSSIMPGVEIGQMPSTRTIGLNITCKF